MKKKKQKISPHITAATAISFHRSSVTLTDEQMAVVAPLSKLDKQIQTLGGLAGSGKTTVVSYLVNKLPGFACCAYTGKAAEVLRSKGVDASTIHSLIYDVQGKKNGSLVFVKRPAVPFSGFIVDEASMVGRDIYDDLTSYGLPVIFVGDHGQLEPVNEDLYLMAKPDYCLETIHRNAGDIARFAYHLRLGNSALTFGESTIVTIIPKRECSPFLLEVDQIICAKNVTRVAINKHIREIKGMRPDSPIIGDRVMSLRNARKHKIYNGSQGTVNHVAERKLHITLSSGAQVALGYNLKSFNQEKVDQEMDGHPFDYAYAITCHKSQGSEWAKVMVLEQNCGGWDHKRWTYTAASRAKEKLIWVTPE